MNVNKPDDENSLKLSDIQIGRKKGAKFKNYDINMPDGDVINLTDGTRITNIEVIYYLTKKNPI